MATASINGITMFYEDTGAPEGNPDAPTVVFLHGAAGSHISWWQQIPTFRAAYRCIAIDHRGFGRSDDTSGEDAAQFTDDLEALVQHLELGRVHLVAQSMGGRSALGYAARQPARVAALVMADTWGFFDWPEQQERAQRLREGQTAPLVNRALAASFQEREPALTFLYQQINNLNPPRQQPAGGMAAGAPTLDEVRATQVPTLCLVGAEDGVTPPELIKALADELPNAEYVEVPGCGHSVYFENPTRFNELVSEFLVRHGGVAVS